MGAIMVEETNTSIISIYELAHENPQLLIIMAIQFMLGLIAGYFTAKIARYVLGLIGVFIVGAILGLWGTAGSIEDALERLKVLGEVKDVIYKLAQVFGFMAVGPTLLGFVVGLTIGVVKK